MNQAEPKSGRSGFHKLLAMLWLSVAGVCLQAQGQSTLPMVAVHDSELTRALATMPATGATPKGAGTTGFQWWITDWPYFVMPESVKEMLRSDGTAHAVISDADITAGKLLTNGVPRYPIMISLAAEAVRDDEIGPLTNYVAAGGFLFVGSSSFSRNPNGTTRTNFAIADQMGVLMPARLNNWIQNTNMMKLVNHRLVDHLPGPMVSLPWQMPESFEEVPWGVSPNHNYKDPHEMWLVDIIDSTTILVGELERMLMIKPYGKGYFIYYAPMQPLVGHGGWAPGMHAYKIFRNAIEWAFENQQMPIAKLSPWRFQHDAAATFRHDLENYQSEITHIEDSARIEFTNGVKGDYYFCTGTLREEIADTNAVIASLRRAVTNYGATIGSHNGGLKNPRNATLTLPDYDYWHWGPDEALDITPSGYANGTAYAKASVSNSFVDIETWLSGINTGGRKFVGCYFNAARDESYTLLDQLQVKSVGEQKISPFPHWTLSTVTPNKRFGHVSIPLSDWYIGNQIVHPLDNFGNGHTTNTIHEAVDFYYDMGALINLYSHTLATGEGDAGDLMPEYIRYCRDQNLHPNLWPANAEDIYQWWLARSNAQITATYSTNAFQAVTTINVTGATDPDTSVEILLPSTDVISGIEVTTNGVPAWGNSYRIKGRVIKVRVGTTVNTVQIRLLTGGDILFSDDFTRETDPAPVSPWVVADGAWAVTGGTLVGGPDSTDSYGDIYLTNAFGTWTDYAVEAKIKFTAGAFGGGLGGRLNPNTGAHYAAWIYPENSPGGDKVLKLIKFQTWNSFGYQGTPFAVMAQANLPGVGTTNHTLKMAFRTNEIAVYFDGQQLITTSDGEAQPYPSGGISLDHYTGTTPFAMTVDDVSVRPLIAGDNYSVAANTALVVAAPGVLGNDTLLGGGTPTATLSALPGHGTVTLNNNGGFTYQPVSNYTGADSFIYNASDAQGVVGSGTVNLTVTGINNGPALLPKTNLTIVELTTLTVTNTAVDTDIPAPILSYSFLTAPTNATISANGIISWTPNESQGPSTNVFTTLVEDDRVPPLSATNTFTVTVTETNAAPVLPGQVNRVVGKLIPLTVTNTATDSDLPANGLTYTLLTGPTNASISLNGVITWTPTAEQDLTTNLFTTVVVDDGIPSRSATNSFTVIVESTPLINLNGTTLISEGCSPTNNAYDPGETISLAFELRNIGRGETANLIATLLATNGVVMPSAPQSYGVVPVNGSASRTFSFALTGSCGGSFTARLRLQDGLVDLGTVSATFPLGWSGTVITQNFDSVTVPALPSGWTTAKANNQPLWVTQNTVRDTLPNAAFTFTTNKIGVNELQTPFISLPSGEAQLTFRHTYSFEAQGATATGFDGGVLELSIGAGNFTNIINAGGTFVTGGYTRTLSSGYGNPLGGQQAWSGTNANFSNVVVNLPAAALGQSIRLRWRCGTDDGGVSGTGWRIDSIGITGSGCCQNSAPVLPVQTNRTLVESTALTVTNTAVDTGIPAIALSYQLLLPPAGATISANGIITWSPDESQGPSTNTITTVATYNGAPPLSTTNSFLVVVTETNAAPVLPSQTNRTLAEQTALIVTNTATDSDLPANSLSYTLPTAPSGAAISPAGIINWTPDEAAGPGVYDFVTVVTDDGVPARSATNNFTVTVTEVNSAPMLPGQTNWTIAELTSLIVTNKAMDSDLPANSLNYLLVNPPVGAQINPAGVITWMPTEEQGPSTNVITTVVFDNGSPVLGATNSFTIVVEEINTAPVLPVLTNLTSSGLAGIVVTNTATDADFPVNELTYQLIDAPANVFINTNGVISWTPAAGQVPSTNLITTVVTDTNHAAVNAQSLSATNTFTITVNAIHNGPALPVLVNRTINETQTLTVTNTAVVSDVPALSLTYGLLVGPAGATISTNGIITWTPTEMQGPGDYTFTTVVIDNGVPQLSAANSFTVHVDEWNHAPVLPLQSNRTSIGVATVTVTNTAVDSDEPANGLSYVLADAPANAVINANGVISWTPQPGQVPSTNLFTTVVTDANPTAINATSLSATNSFTVVIAALRSPPVFPAQSNLVINEEVTLLVTNTASDSNIPALGLDYVMLNAPAGVLIDTNGVITWTPTEAQGPATNVLVTVATDRGEPPLSTTNSFTVVVNEVNHPPVLLPQPDLSVPELVLLTVTNAASDIDLPANTLTYSLINPPVGATIDASGVITWLPLETQSPGTNLFITVVTDNGTPALSATNQFTVVVTEVNSAPSLSAQPDRAVAELATLVVTNAATDSDRPVNVLSYTLLNAPEGAVIDSNGVITWTPTEAQGPGTNVIITVVTDDGVPALSVTNSFTVVVSEINVAPELPPVPQQEVFELSTLTVTNTASDIDQPANALSYALLTAPAGATISANGVITWAPGESDGPATNSFVTVVTDNGIPALSATNQFTVIVREVNEAPTLPSQANRTLSGLESLVVTNTASDTDVPANSIAYQLVNAPAGAIISGNGVITWTPIAAQVPSTNIFTTIATDSNPSAAPPNLSATNTFTVVVNAIHNGPSLPPVSAQTVIELSTLVITNTASQQNIPALGLSYMLLNPPTGAVIDPNGVVTWTPEEAQGPATNILTTVVTDSGVPPLSATNSISVVVQESNSAPTLPPQSNRDLLGYQQLVVTNTATDTDAPANALTYQLTQLPAGAAINAQGVITWTPAAAQIPGTFVIETVVTDNNPSAVNAHQLSATNQFTVTTHTVHNGPSLPVQTARSVNELTTLTVTNTAINNDVPATVLSYSLVNPPVGAQIDTNGIITWTPSELQGGTTNTITTLVVDNGDPVKYSLNLFIVVVNEVNSAPMLSAQTNRTILELTTLSVTNAAVDLDDPINTLNYTLVNPPVGAVISPAGVITWTPTAAQSPGTNLITTIVTDNGLPAMSATNSFTVVVAKPVAMTPPVIQSINVSNGVAVITWSSISGRSYRVQYKQNLTDANWTDLPPDVTATSATTSKTDAVGSVPRRFYRVVMLGTESVPAAHPPINVSLGVSNGMATVSWNAVTGRTYQVQYKLNLTDTNWLDLSSPVTAAAGIATKADSVAGLSRRFYRVMLVP